MRALPVAPAADERRLLVEAGADAAHPRVVRRDAVTSQGVGRGVELGPLDLKQVRQRRSGLRGALGERAAFVVAAFLVVEMTVEQCLHARPGVAHERQRVGWVTEVRPGARPFPDVRDPGAQPSELLDGRVEQRRLVGEQPRRVDRRRVTRPDRLRRQPEIAQDEDPVQPGCGPDPRRRSAGSG